MSYLLGTIITGYAPQKSEKAHHKAIFRLEKNEKSKTFFWVVSP